MQSQATARRGQENELTIAVEFSATLPEAVTVRFAHLSRRSELAADLNADSLGFTFSKCSDISRAVERKIEGWQHSLAVPNAEIQPEGFLHLSMNPELEKIRKQNRIKPT